MFIDPIEFSFPYTGKIELLAFGEAGAFIRVDGEMPTYFVNPVKK